MDSRMGFLFNIRPHGPTLHRPCPDPAYRRRGEWSGEGPVSVERTWACWEGSLSVAVGCWHACSSWGCRARRAMALASSRCLLVLRSGLVWSGLDWTGPDYTNQPAGSTRVLWTGNSRN
jgi:hypothetical protein